MLVVAERDATSCKVQFRRLLCLGIGSPESSPSAARVRRRRPAPCSRRVTDRGLAAQLGLASGGGLRDPRATLGRLDLGAIKVLPASSLHGRTHRCQMPSNAQRCRSCERRIPSGHEAGGGLRLGDRVRLCTGRGRTFPSLKPDSDAATQRPSVLAVLCSHRILPAGPAGGSRITRIRWGRRWCPRRPLLLFMPHCDRALYEAGRAMPPHIAAQSICGCVLCPQMVLAENEAEDEGSARLTEDSASGLALA